MPSTRTLSEWDSKRLLAEHGVPMPTEAVAADPAQAADVAAELGFPVVAKLCGAGIAHKTERGLVRLGLEDRDAVERAARDLLDSAEAADGDVAVLVGPQVSGNRELIAGIHHDDQFGPCVMLGVGGILAEAVADVSFRLVPLEEVDAEEMVEDLRTQALLGHFRGEPPVDRAELVSVLLGLSRLATERADVVGVDLNPLIVVDGVPVPVDALVELAGSAEPDRGAR